MRRGAPARPGSRPCGWRDLSEAIAAAAATTRLAVYRNPGPCLAGDGACGDLDLLVENVDAALLALGVAGAGTDAASARPAAGAVSEAWSEHHFGVHLAGGAMALVEVRGVDDPAGFGDGVGGEWRRDMLARRECAPWGEGGACVVSERDQFYALLHGALADGARIQARYADALESMAPRVGDDAAAAVTNGTVAALAAGAPRGVLQILRLPRVQRRARAGVPAREADRSSPNVCEKCHQFPAIHPYCYGAALLPERPLAPGGGGSDPRSPSTSLPRSAGSDNGAGQPASLMDAF